MWGKAVIAKLRLVEPPSLKSIVESKEGHTGNDDNGTDDQSSASNDVSPLKNISRRKIYQDRSKCMATS